MNRSLRRGDGGRGTKMITAAGEIEERGKCCSGDISLTLGILESGMEGGALRSEWV